LIISNSGVEQLEISTSSKQTEIGKQKKTFSISAKKKKSKGENKTKTGA
jgi:hypothetical protein